MLPNELKLHILLQIDNEKDLIAMCRIDKEYMEVCMRNKNVISKHIMKDIYGIHKPSTIDKYSTFYRHYKQLRKVAPHLYGLSNDPTIEQISEAYNYWYELVEKKMLSKGLRL